METINTVSILIDACLKSDIEQTSIIKIPPSGCVYFNNIVAHAGDTLSALTSVMTGYDVFGHGISSLYRPLMDGGNTTYPKARAFPTLPMLLRHKDINTFLIGEDNLWLSFGYKWIVPIENLSVDTKSDKQRLLQSEVISELDEPFFLHIHLWSSHLRGNVDDNHKVETFADKSANIKRLDGYIRRFIGSLWEKYPNTQILIWSDHGDIETEQGMRHAGILHENVQGVWAILLNQAFKDKVIDNRLHAQADLFRLINGNISDNEDIPRYATDPMTTQREKVWAASWRSDTVKRYPDGKECKIDEMIEIDVDFQEHIRNYGHLVPVDFPPIGSNWPHEKVVERLKSLGYM